MMLFAEPVTISFRPLCIFNNISDCLWETIKSYWDLNKSTDIFQSIILDFQFYDDMWKADAIWINSWIFSVSVFHIFTGCESHRRTRKLVF